MRLEITVMGDVALRRDDGVRRFLAGRKPRVALALLVLERDRGATRDQLADALWPDGLPASWPSALRMVVSRVRTFLRRVLPPGAPDPISARSGRYLLRVPDGTVLVVDVEQAAMALATARRALTEHDLEAAQSEALQAVTLLRGPFLPRHQGGWADEQRDRLSDSLVAALEVASEAATAAGNLELALATADAAVQRAPLRESAHRLRMAAHASAGNRGEALLAYQRLRRVLAHELGIDPDAKTEAAYLELLGPAHPVRAVATAGRTSTAPDSWVAAVPTAVAAASSGLRGDTPFVGRQGELATIDAAWDASIAGARHMVVVTGEAGIGKTRLATEAARRVASRGGLVLFGRCDAEAIVPFQPIVEALDGYVAARPAGELALDDGARAELATVLPSLPGARRVGGEAERPRLFDAVTALLSSAAADRPVLLLLDDMQRADADTLLLLRHVLRRAGTAPVLVVALARASDPAHDVGLHDLVRDLDREGWIRRLPLRGLDEADVRSMLAPTGGTPADRAALALHLVDETAGNPFLLTEMLRDGVDAGLVDQAIPASVHDLVAGWLAQLDPAAADLLRAGAVAGRRFEVDLAATCAGLGGHPALDAVDAALRSGLVAEETNERFHFRHGIVRRTVVAQLSGPRRRALHAHLVDAIESRRADRLDEYTAALAHHSAAGAGAAGDRRALRWSRAAAAQASRRRAFTEAVGLQRQALVHVPPDDGGLRAEVVTDLAIAQLAAGDPDVESALVEGAALARREGRVDLLARGALALADHATGHADLRPEALALIGAALDAVGGAATAAGASEARPSAPDITLLHARLLARQLALRPPSNGTARARPPAATVQTVRARLAELGGPHHLDERMVLADDLAVLAAEAGDPTAVVTAAHERTMVAAITGDDAGARSSFQVVFDAAVRQPDPVTIALTAEQRAKWAVMSGWFSRAPAAIASAANARWRLDGAAAAAELARRHLAILHWLRQDVGPAGPSPGLDDRRADRRGVNPTGRPETLLALMARGDRAGARLLLRDLATGARSLPAGDAYLHALGVLGLAAADLADADAAAHVRALIAPHADLTCGVGYLTFAGVASFHLGRLAAVEGNWAEAERHLLVAMRRYSALGARPWMALTQQALAGVLEARGRPSDRDWVAALRAEAGWAASTLGLRAS